MNRRGLLKLASAAPLASFMTQRHLNAQAKVDRATRALPSPIIKDIQTITTQPAAPTSTRP